MRGGRPTSKRASSDLLIRTANVELQRGACAGCRGLRGLGRTLALVVELGANAESGKRRAPLLDAGAVLHRFGEGQEPCGRRRVEEEREGARRAQLDPPPAATDEVLAGLPAGRPDH